MYYLYACISLIESLFVLRNERLGTLAGLLRLLAVRWLFFAGCVLVHAVVISVISLFADRGRRWDNMNNVFRKVALSTITLMLHIVRARVEVHGAEKIPQDRRFVLIGNHRSIFDPMVAMDVFRDYDLGFISKQENVQLPFFGRLMLASGVIPLNREDDRAAVRSILQAIRTVRGNIASMGIFPEGGINSTDEPLLPFHPGSFQIATRSKAPIVVVTFRNTEQLHRRCLFARTTVSLDVLRVIEPEEYAGMNTIQLSGMVWQEMYAHLSGRTAEAPLPEGETPQSAA